MLCSSQVILDLVVKKNEDEGLQCLKNFTSKVANYLIHNVQGTFFPLSVSSELALG